MRQNAYESVQNSCLDMTKEEKLVFSWNVFLCYYEDTRRTLPSCSSSDVRACTQKLSPSDFDIFTQFFHHGDSMCYYRESREWQERVDRSVHKLEKAATQTVAMLYANASFSDAQGIVHSERERAARLADQESGNALHHPVAGQGSAKHGHQDRRATTGTERGDSRSF